MSNDIVNIAKTYGILINSMNNDDNIFIESMHDFIRLLDLENKIYISLDPEKTITKKDKIDKYSEVMSKIINNSTDEIKAILIALEIARGSMSSVEYISNRISDPRCLILPFKYINDNQTLMYLDSFYETVKYNFGTYPLEIQQEIKTELVKTIVGGNIDDNVINEPEFDGFKALINHLKFEVKEKIKEAEKAMEAEKIREAEKANLDNAIQVSSMTVVDFCILFNQLSDNGNKIYALNKYLKLAIKNDKNTINIILTHINDLISRVDDNTKMTIISLTYNDQDFINRVRNEEINEPSFHSMDTYNNFKNFAFMQFDDIKVPTKYFLENNQFRELKSIQWRNDFPEKIDEYLSLFGYGELTKRYFNELMNLQSDIYKNFDFRLLSDKYINNLSPYEMFLLLDYTSNIDLVNISPNKFEILVFAMHYFPKENEYTDYIRQIKNGMRKYNDVLDIIKFDNLSQNAKRNLIMVLTNNYSLEITNSADLENIELCLEKATSLDMQENDISIIKDKIILKKYGMGYASAERLYNKYLQAMKADPRYAELILIIESNDSIFLRDVYKKIVNVHELVDVIAIERQFASVYEKEINSNLISTQSMQLLEKSSNGIPIYDAGDNFKMIINARAPFIHEAPPENYKDDWNRKKSSSSIMCASIISNEMLGRCTSPEGVYYGFDHIENGALQDMGTSDIQSFSSQLGSYRNGTSQFCTTQELINKTGYPRIRNDLYNEVNIKRETNGQKIQPSFVIAFKFNGEISNLSSAYKVSRDFDNLPIVVIDVDRLISKGINEINALTMDFESNPSPEKLQNIWIKFHNYAVTFSVFYGGNFHEKVNLPKEITDNIIVDRFKLFYDINNKAFNITYNETKSEQDFVK